MSDEEPRNNWDWEQPETGLIRGDVPTAPMEDIGTGDAAETTIRTEPGPGTPLPPPEPAGGVDRRKALWLVGLIALVAVVVVGVVAMTGGGDDGDRVVAVPDLTGLDQDEAEGVLRDAGLALGEVSSRPGEAGAVVSQSPGRGVDADEGAPIDIVVGDGTGDEPTATPTPTPSPTPTAEPEPQLVSVPAVRGLPATEAESQLASAGLEVEVRQVADASVPEGNAIGTSPGDGSSLGEGDPIVLLISSGPARLGVPDVTGRNPLDASAELINLGFEVDTATCVLEAGQDGDSLVVEQTPPGGDEAELGSIIEICVGATPPPTPTATPAPRPPTPRPVPPTPVPEPDCPITDDTC